MNDKEKIHEFFRNVQKVVELLVEHDPQSFKDFIDILNKNFPTSERLTYYEAQKDGSVLVRFLDPDGSICETIGKCGIHYENVKRHIISLIRKLRSKSVKEKVHTKGLRRYLIAQLNYLLYRVSYCYMRTHTIRDWSLYDKIRCDSLLDLIEYHRNIGLFFKVLGQFSDAQEHFAAAIDIIDEILTKDHTCAKKISDIHIRKTYIEALLHESKAQERFYGGKLQEAIDLFKEAADKYKTAKNNTNALWCEGAASLLYSIEKALTGDTKNIKDAILLLVNVRNNIYPKIKDEIEKVSQRGTTLDRLFIVTFAKVVSNLADNYWRLLSNVYEIMLNMIYQYRGYLLLPKTVQVDDKTVIEVDLNAIKYEGKTLYHVIGECKMNPSPQDIKRFFVRAKRISNLIKRNPLLKPRNYSYRAKIILLSETLKDSRDIHRIFSEIFGNSREYERKILTSKEIEKYFKEIMTETPVYTSTRIL